MKKTLQDLTIKDNFMFGAVMTDPENCKGVRLDVYAKDDTNTRYNIEMQVLRKSTLGKRSRYYHSQIDMDLLLSGSDYRELPDTYVIFICDFDPFGFGKYSYSFYTACREEGSLAFNDGLYTIFLSTAGKKENREMEERFMLLEELLQEEHEEGLRQGRIAERTENIQRLTDLLFSLLKNLTNFLTVFLRKLKQKKILLVSCNGSSSQPSLHPFRIFYQRLNNLFHSYQKKKTKEKGISVPLLHSGCFKNSSEFAA